MEQNFSYNPGFDIKPDFKGMNFFYGDNAFGVKPELRRLDDIRSSLKDPTCSGTDILYSIAMDVGDIRHKEEIQKRNLLYGAVIYNSGTIGKECVRSQGHIHAVSPSCGSSTCEVYEIWSGHAVIYMQETTNEEPGRCFAVHAYPGDKVIVPPYWVHATINAEQYSPMAFGAWCVRDYGFEYKELRAKGGIAFFPIAGKTLRWEKNPSYRSCHLNELNARSYEEIGIKDSSPIFSQFVAKNELFDFIPHPEILSAEKWESILPEKK
ncbi:MAG: glucose-6-phosphate isomerase family protein [Candidatus Ornithospirochaeta sp.]|nr:glucose-6-phosphate isomerase family protein [Sphaerochaetaceae bacterium]MDY5523300.1 glucose-6-phosphate isomerase family protein [Candidatus Ornithospirochaeta sp.]